MECFWLTQNTLKTEKVSEVFTIHFHNIKMVQTSICLNISHDHIKICILCIYIFLTWSFSPHFLDSVCDSDLCVSLWPRGSWRVGIVLQKGPLHLHLPGFSSTAWGAQTTQPPAGAPAQKAWPARTPLQLHCNYYFHSSHSAACVAIWHTLHLQMLLILVGLVQ